MGKAISKRQTSKRVGEPKGFSRQRQAKKAVLKVAKLHSAATGKQSSGEVRIGARLKHARLIKGLRLQDLANTLECSESFLSKIENNKVRPSLSMLHQITSALDISIAVLFAGQNEPDIEQIQIIRAKERQIIRTNPVRSGPGIALERLVAMERSTLLEVNIHRVDPGGHTDGVISHEGEEIGFLLEGNLELELNGTWYAFSEGDSFFFRSTLPHGYRNVGDKTAQVLWVNTPPTF
jgi:transcriptional regulator with XRE-family HTH domain